jgi:hypothetical protein
MNRHASDDMEATPGGTGDGTRRMLEEEADRAREAARRAQDAGTERLEEGAGQAAEGVEHVADAVGAAASRLSEMEHEGLAEHANRLASWLSGMSEKLRNRSVDEIGNDVRRIAERNPALFLLGSVAVGVALARFAKASGRDEPRADGAAGEAAWSSAASRPETGGDAEWTGDIASREFEPSEGGVSTYEGRDSGSRPGERSTTPDSSGGSGL